MKSAVGPVVACIGLWLSGPVRGPAAEVARPGEWTVHRGVSGAHAVLGVQADDALAMLIVRCDGGASAVSIKWGGCLGQSAVAVRARVDGTESRVGSWPLSADCRETLYPGDALAYVRQLRGSRKLVATVTPQAGMTPMLPVADPRDARASRESQATAAVPLSPPPPARVTATFGLRGLQTVLHDAADTCGLR